MRSLLPAFVFLVTAPLLAKPPQFIAITDVVVISGEGAIYGRKDVVITGERISSVSDAGTRRPFPRHTKVISGKGRYLMPGLWDCHVHLSKAGRHTLPLYIANGITSVRDMGSDYEQVMEWKREIAAGVIAGPRIRTPGPMLESKANVDRMKREGTVEPVDRLRAPVDTPEDAVQWVERLALRGVDFLKVRTIPSPEAYRALADTARRFGLQLAGHQVATLEDTLRSRQGSVEHLLYPPLDKLTEAQRRVWFHRMEKQGTFMGTTLVNVEGSLLVSKEKALAVLDDWRGTTDARRKYVSGYLVDDWREQIHERTPDYTALVQKLMPAAVEDMKQMRTAGVKILPGTDVGVALIYPGFSMHDELKCLVKDVGLTPAEAIRAATQHPAEWFGIDRSLGTIAAGRYADLVLMDANPLDDIANTRRIRAVVQNGRLYDRGDLDGMLRQVESAARSHLSTRR